MALSRGGNVCAQMQGMCPPCLPSGRAATLYQAPSSAEGIWQVRRQSIWRRGPQRLWTIPRGGPRQAVRRVSEEENSNSTVVTLVCSYCKVHSICVSGINNCNRYVRMCSLLDPWMVPHTYCTVKNSMYCCKIEQIRAAETTALLAKIKIFLQLTFLLKEYFKRVILVYYRSLALSWVKPATAIQYM